MQIVRTVIVCRTPRFVWRGLSIGAVGRDSLRTQNANNVVVWYQDTLSDDYASIVKTVDWFQTPYTNVRRRARGGRPLFARARDDIRIGRRAIVLTHSTNSFSRARTTSVGRLFVFNTISRPASASGTVSFSNAERSCRSKIIRNLQMAKENDLTCPPYLNLTQSVRS